MSEAAMLEAVNAVCNTVVWCSLIGGSIYFLLKIIEEKFHTEYAEQALENIQKEMEYQQKSQMMESSQELLEVSEN